MNSSCSNRSRIREYHLRLPNDFHHPIDLLQRVYDQQVVLEHIFTRESTAYGTIRVTNRALEKKVLLLYTIDRWRTSSIINARYSTHYSDNNTDIFQFKLLLSQEEFSTSKNLLFAICYQVNGEEFWDNNYSRDYTLDIIEILNQKSILPNDILHRQIARDYYAISNTFEQAGNLCGLKNLGGTCYMNSILQSLSFTSLLTDYFLSNEYSNVKNTINGIVANEYLNFLCLLCSKKYGVITPIPIKQIIGYVEQTYFENQQQDAHEFLIFLLDRLHQELISIKSNENQTNNNQIIDHSIITDIFYGTYRSTITCLKCNQVSYNLEPFICLNLPIPFTNQCTLEDCLAYLNEEEYLTDDSKWFCSSCQCLCNVKKRLEIYKLPKILIIQLKRFQLDFEMNWIKNDTLVLYPEDNLHLSSSSSYTLYSVINHNGSLNDGHFTTFSRDSSSNLQLWFECDDENINYLPTDQLNLNSKAYLLFYTSQPTNMSF